VFVEAWMDAGRLFHTAGPAWLNACSPKTVFNFGILYSSLSVDRSPGHVVLVADTVVLVMQWLSVGLVIERSLGMTPGWGAIKSTRSTQPSIPPGVGKSSTGLYGWG